MVLTIDDLPPGWSMGRETRLRMGFGDSGERSKRARRAKLVGATRIFVHPESRSRVSSLAYPMATTEDARAAVADAFQDRLTWRSVNTPTLDELEVTPPPEAGEHASAFVVGAAGPLDARRALTVVWAESAPLLLGITYHAHADSDLWDLTSDLIRRQRERVAHVVPPS